MGTGRQGNTWESTKPRPSDSHPVRRATILPTESATGTHPRIRAHLSPPVARRSYSPFSGAICSGYAARVSAALATGSVVDLPGIHYGRIAAVCSRTATPSDSTRPPIRGTARRGAAWETSSPTAHPVPVQIHVRNTSGFYSPASHRRAPGTSIDPLVRKVAVPQPTRPVLQPAASGGALYEYAIPRSVYTTTGVVAFVVAWSYFWATRTPNPSIPFLVAPIVAVVAVVSSWPLLYATIAGRALQQHSVWRSVLTSVCLVAFIVAWAHVWTFRSPGSGYALVLVSGAATIFKVASRIDSQSVLGKRAPVRARTFNTIHGGTFTVADSEVAQKYGEVLPGKIPVRALTARTYTTISSTGGWKCERVMDSEKVAYVRIVRTR